MKYINSYINFDLIDYYVMFLYKNCKFLSICEKVYFIFRFNIDK